MIINEAFLDFGASASVTAPLPRRSLAWIPLTHAFMFKYEHSFTWLKYGFVAYVG
jgi:hypothetical protein